jgi:curved DNA-binding protein CbpA
MKKAYKSLEILGLEPGATFQEVKTSYRNLCKKWHPDRYSKFPEVKEETHTRIKEIINAYEILKDYNDRYGLENLAAVSDQQYVHIYDSRYDSYEEEDFSDISGFHFEYFLLQYYNRIKTAFITMLLIIVIGLFYSFIIYKEPVPEAFDIGSSRKVVELIQGEPSFKTDTTWYYDRSKVVFNRDRVIGYENKSNNLNIRRPQHPMYVDYFKHGSSKDFVRSIQGEPSKIIDDTWYYGISFVRFRDNRVYEYLNLAGNLKIDE